MAMTKLDKCPRCRGQLLVQWDDRTRRREPSCLQCGWSGETLDPVEDPEGYNDIREGDPHRGTKSARHYGYKSPDPLTVEEAKLVQEMVDVSIPVYDARRAVYQRRFSRPTKRKACSACKWGLTTLYHMHLCSSYRGAKVRRKSTRPPITWFR